MADVPRFKVGDLVKLKSGGPVMTVGFLFDAWDGVTCYWFPPSDPSIGSGPGYERMVPPELKKADLPAHCLDPVPLRA